VAGMPRCKHRPRSMHRPASAVEPCTRPHGGLACFESCLGGKPLLSLSSIDNPTLKARGERDGSIWTPGYLREKGDSTLGTCLLLFILQHQQMTAHHRSHGLGVPRQTWRRLAMPVRSRRLEMEGAPRFLTRSASGRRAVWLDSSRERPVSLGSSNGRLSHCQAQAHGDNGTM